MKNLHIIVTGDVNDGDYISETTDISDLTKEEVKEIYKKIKNYDPETDEYDDEVEEYLPFLDNNELHTITNVELVIMKTIKVKDVV